MTEKESRPIYLMVTDWDKHWDNIRRTYYTRNRLRNGMNEALLVEDAPTFFVKLCKRTGKSLRGWIGAVGNFEPKEKKIYFNVTIKAEIALSEVPENYLRLAGESGWYYIGAENLAPPFLALLRTTNNPGEFEYYVYILLKCLGVNDIHRFTRQKGHPDGVFRLSKMVVLYDCTIGDVHTKQRQIENFYYQLTKDEISIGNRTIRIAPVRKSVWIIGRGGASKTLDIRDDIHIRFISIEDLLALYDFRLQKLESEEDLEEKFWSLGKQTSLD